MRTCRSILQLVSVAVTLCSLCGAARAQDSDPDPSRAYFGKGVELFEKNDFLGAIEQFELADRARHSPIIIYNIARAKESLGLAQSAFDAYEAYMSEAGAQGEFLGPASVAVARIKTRAMRLRIETQPPGAIVRVDGHALRDRSPASVLLFRGRHRIDVEIDGWQGGQDYDAPGEGKAATIKIDKPAPTPPPPAPKPKAPPAPREFGGLTAGFGFALDYSALVVSAKPPSDSDPKDYDKSSVMFGLNIEAGYAFHPRYAAMLRGNCGLGDQDKGFFSLGSLAATLSLRATRRWWVGGGAILGASKKDYGANYAPLFGATKDDTIVVGDQVALGPALEAGFVIGENDEGQWVLSLLPGLLLGTGQGQSTLLIPLVLGHRWY